jgi:YD repeat-containing protein
MRTFFAIAAFALTVGSASAQSRTYYDGQGRFAGSSVTRGHSSSYYGGNGQFAGSSVRHGNSTSFYDGQGRFTGSSIGPRR